MLIVIPTIDVARIATFHLAFLLGFFTVPIDKYGGS